MWKKERKTKEGKSEKDRKNRAEVMLNWYLKEKEKTKKKRGKEKERKKKEES